jgi:hypothetical protein
MKSENSMCYSKMEQAAEVFLLDTELIPKYIRKSASVHWIYDQFAVWKGKFSVNFTEIRTMIGMGYSINLIDAKSLFDLNQ